MAGMGVGARVRSSVGLRLCEFLFEEIHKLNRFAPRAAVEGCRAVIRLLFMDVITALALDQRLTRQAIDERGRMIEETAAEFLKAMAEVRRTVDDTSCTMLDAADAAQALAGRAKEETARSEESWSAGSERIKAMAEGARAMSTSIVEISEHTEVPGNRQIGHADRLRRQEEIFWPYHRRIAEELDRRKAQGIQTILVSMHSFTPVFKSVGRQWHVGVLYNRDPSSVGGQLPNDRLTDPLGASGHEGIFPR